ncbi:MAG TPA: DNA-3-methyladenine glycosylase [Jiangellaceae bacterium]|nr:DNA-3-methyladenine glycosylase [Jiangellaceae bacterium]
MSDGLGRAFFERPVLEVAPSVLGCVVVNGPVAVRLTEVEAYDGAGDPGSHAFRGRTARNAVMFGPPGHVYVYFTYGMHWCANLVCGPTGTASAVLLRAGEVVTGLDVARSRRPSARSDHELARGPARLATALGLGGHDNGADLCDAAAPLRLRPAARPAASVRTGPRVGLALAGDRPWRFWLEGDPTVSTYRAHLPRRRTAARRP